MRPNIVVTPAQWIFSVCLVVVVVFAFVWMCRLLKMGADAAQEWAEEERKRVESEEEELNKILKENERQD